MIEHLSAWGLTPSRPRPDIFLPGSPERCVIRTAVEDETGTVWMLEKLRPGQFDSRERIGRALRTLSGADLPIPAYVADPQGRFVVERGNDFYQIAPYIPGDELPQPEFIEDEERGVALGSFVAHLHRAGAAIREFDADPPFILEDYVNELMAKMAPRRPEIHQALLPVLGTLAPLFEAWNDLPHALCQGDFHPLNVIWQDQSVGAVIDWEFMGRRPKLFDVANCLGCVGIEEPRSLVNGLAPAMLITLRDNECLDHMSLSMLPEMVLGIRFAWMSEWLRKKDEEMAQIEVAYMRLLANSIDTLLPAWQSILEG